MRRSCSHCLAFNQHTPAHPLADGIVAVPARSSVELIPLCQMCARPVGPCARAARAERSTGRLAVAGRQCTGGCTNVWRVGVPAVYVCDSISCAQLATTFRYCAMRGPGKRREELIYTPISASGKWKCPSYDGNNDVELGKVMSARCITRHVHVFWAVQLLQTAII